jgi:hypothetical protein
MWKRFVVAAGIGAAVLGGGAAALATTGATSTVSGHAVTAASPTPTSTGSSSSTPTTHGKHPRRAAALLRLKSFEHGEWTSREPGSTADVVHVAVKGKVSAVSATSISVTATDGYQATYVVNSDTKVRLRGAGKTSSTIANVKTGDTVLVSGTKSGATLTANHVLDGAGK